LLPEVDEQTNTLLDFLAAENDTVAAGAQKPVERPTARRHPAAPSPPPRHARSIDAIHAVQAARQENDQVKAKSFKIWTIRARSDGRQRPTPFPGALPLLLPCRPARSLTHAS